MRLSDDCVTLRKFSRSSWCCRIFINGSYSRSQEWM